jgi:hypothetical protein
MRFPAGLLIDKSIDNTNDNTNVEIILPNFFNKSTSVVNCRHIRRSCISLKPEIIKRIYFLQRNV